MRILALSLVFTCSLLYFQRVEAQVPELDWPIEIVSEGHGFTEGASLASDGHIYFSDMDNQQILRFDPSSGSTEIWSNKSGKSNGLYIHDNHLYACEAVGRSIVQYDLAKGPESRIVLTSTFNGDSLGSPNDITIIGDHIYFSEFWIAGFHRNTGAQREIFRNRVYSLSLKNGEMDSLAFHFETPNGVASSPDGEGLYLTDFKANKLYRAQLKNGKPGAFELLADFNKLDKQGPDGLTISQDGRIFQALFRSGELLVLDQAGNALGYLPTGTRTTNCIFAADGKTLYITADHKLKRVVLPD